MPLTDRFIDISTEAIIAIDTDRIIRIFNPAAERMLGYAADEVLGQPIDRLLPEHVVADMRARFTSFVTSPDSFLPPGRYREWNARRKDGTEIPLEITLSAFDDGGRRYFVAVARDISARQRTEADLRQSEARYRALYNHTPVMLHSIDRDSRLISVSDHWLATLGYTRDEVLGRKSTDFLTEASRRYATDVVLPEFMRTGYCHNIEYQFVKKTGEVIDCLLSAIAERDADGQMLRSLAVIIDITERKHASEALRQAAAESERLYRAAERRRRELEALHEIEQAISALDVDRCLQAVATHAQALMQAELGRVFLIEPDGLHLHAASGLNVDQAGQLVLPHGRGLCGWAAEHGAIVYAPDAQVDPRYIPTIRATRSEAAIPLIYQSQVFGVLDVQSSRLAAFTPSDIDLLNRLAAQASIAISNARLFNAEREQRILAEALRDTAAALNSRHRLGDVLDNILANVGRVVPHDAANVMLIEAGAATIARARGYSERGSDEAARPSTWSIHDIPDVARIAETGETVLIAETHGHPDWIDLPGTRWIRSYVGVPIHIQGRVAGVLNLNSATPGFFTAMHAERLKAFADQAAIAIENAQLLAETRRQAERELLINQITNRIRSSMDLDEVLRTTVQELGPSLGVSRCLVRLGADADYMPIAHEFVQPGITALGDRSSGLLPGTRQKLMAQQTLAIDNTRATAPLLYQTGVQAILATPITAHHILLGALVFQECDHPRHWQPDEIDLIETIAAQVGVAIENARLYHETRQQLSELTILHTAAIATAGSTSLDEALHQVARSVQEAMGAVNVAVMLVDPDRDELTTRASAGDNARAIEQVHLRIGQGVTGWVAQTGQPALLPDVAADPRYVEVDERIQSELCVPLKVGARIIGVLNVESQQRDAFAERDLQLLTTLSHNLTVIIENIRLLEEVRAANEQLQELDRLKSQFLANMSHELRTPLNAIIGFSELLSDGLAGPLNSDQRDYLHNIHHSGKHLLDMINDILDLSKIQAGRMTLDWRDFDMAQLVHEAQTFVAPTVARKQQRLSLNLQPNLPLVHADPLRVKQVLINLLSNACKFTPDGGAITVHVNLIEEDLLLVQVSDTGRGIPPSHQTAIFEEFRQVNGADGKEEGTGLGLAIAQRLIELHGGKIWVESAGQPGLGSTFYFTLPMQPETVAPSADRSAPPTAVIVEDDQAFSDLLALHLHQIGYRTRQCYDGGQVLPTLRAVKPDLITLDMLLPKQDGWSILREIKADPMLRDIGVLIISASEQAQAAATPGRVEYLSKPLLKSKLVNALERLKTPRADRAVRVLVVDDDPLLTELLKAILPPPDYDVVTAINGLWAIEQMIDNLPDVIILDLLLPDMNGFDLLSALRADPRTHDLPVLVLTAKNLTPAEQAELSRTAQAVMTRSSLRRDRLMAEIDRLRRMRNTAAHSTV